MDAKGSRNNALQKRGKYYNKVASNSRDVSIKRNASNVRAEGSKLIPTTTGMQTISETPPTAGTGTGVILES